MLDKNDLQAIAELMDVKLAPISERLDKLEQGQKALEEGQQDIKKLIVKNNVAIGEVLTQVLEDSQKKPNQNKLYKIIPLEG